MRDAPNQEQPKRLPAMFTEDFWVEAADRAFKAAGYTLLAAWGSEWTGPYALGWDTTWRMALGMAMISLLGSMVSAPLGRRGTATLLPMRRR